MTSHWDLILDGYNDGKYNMARDEALLYRYIETGRPVFRIYGWKDPFVTLGYSQDPQDIFKLKVPFVKRITAGAAILHYRELTYSLACRREDLDLPLKVKDSFKTLNRFLIEFYKRLGLKAAFAVDIVPSLKLDRVSHYCFGSFQSYDIVINGKKIGGNAQRRKKDIIFQHGSIPRDIDFSLLGSWIKDVDGLKDKTTDLKQLLGKATDFNRLAFLLAESFQATLGVKFTLSR